jgi:glyoxylase-like metal-dependent hydrolase (beta-lactamase superfamily II)
MSDRGGIDLVGDAPIAANLDVQWIHGVRNRKRETEPRLQVHEVDPHTVLIRQSKVATYEAPFLYLLFGNDRALLLDTGAVADPDAMPVRATVDGLVQAWLAAHPREHYELVVAHTHGHGDHVAGDAQFADRPLTTVVASDADSVQRFFGIEQWPSQLVTFDLGGRPLEVTGIPGHHVASIAVYDPRTGFLLTGDTVYPGRLYVNDMPAFVDSLERLVHLCDTRPVSHVMGCHIEMTTTPGRDYPVGTRYQPDEPPLPMTPRQLRAIAAAARVVESRPGAHRLDDVIIFNGRCAPAVLKQVARLVAARVGCTRPRWWR